MVLGGATPRTLGSLDAVRLSGELPAVDSAAVAAFADALATMRNRTAARSAIDALDGVALVLRDEQAGRRGPWATTGAVHVGAVNALAERIAGATAREGVVLTVDAAIHELVHVVQFSRIPEHVRPHAALLEGIADAATLLATGDGTLGEDYWRRDALGRPTGAIRLLGRTAGGAAAGAVAVIAPTVSTLAAARGHVDAEHTAGGVVTAVFEQLRGALGTGRAERLLWHVITDDAAWSSGGSWDAFAAALRRAASASELAAVDAALGAAGFTPRARQ